TVVGPLVPGIAMACLRRPALAPQISTTLAHASDACTVVCIVGAALAGIATLGRETANSSRWLRRRPGACHDAGVRQTTYQHHGAVAATAVRADDADGASATIARRTAPTATRRSSA